MLNQYQPESNKNQPFRRVDVLRPVFLPVLSFLMRYLIYLQKMSSRAAIVEVLLPESVIEERLLKL